MKQALREHAEGAGLLGFMHDVRASVLRDVDRWVRAGCPSPAPEVVKKRIVRRYVLDFNTPVFIETGTFLGNMVEYVARTGVKCHSIEVDPALYERAKTLFANRDSINIVLGDSGEELPRLLTSVAEPATFWLDGHYSGWSSGRSNIDTPVSQELDAILNHPVKGHVILIDDARLFTGHAGYPRLSSLLAQFDNHAAYHAWVSADIIRIEPRRAAI